jgi:putative membrane-bound dehydrogenase-like protein
MIHRVFLRLIFLAAATLSIHSLGMAVAGPPDTETATTRALPPDQAAAGFRVSPGFHVQAFAAEPDVENPVAMAWDPRGRLWIAENFTYAELPTKFDLRLRDRVLIFEDADGDGRFDKRTVFTEDVQMLTSVELGQGGVWLMCPPQLLFIPDRDGNDIPDGPAEVVLDGFTPAGENHHTLANGLRWGPDGWLYGRCGASSPGQVGRPGTPESKRIPLRGGLWRYHPLRKRFEVLTHGTTNPWGHDWNALGEGFFINTVNGHLWHLIPGAHFVRPHTIEPNPRVYRPIDQHADHYHWDNSRELNYGPSTRPEDDKLGGGHAHSGLMIYLADQWPEAERGKLFTLNFHGRRFNVERLERQGSGYVGKHEPDTFFAADPWFRGIDLGYGPDGGVFVLDWSDTGECHDHNGVHRTSGRVYKFTYGQTVRPPLKRLDGLDDLALVELHRHPSEWFVRQARRVVLDRCAAGKLTAATGEKLRGIADDGPDPVLRLRAIWTLFALGQLDHSGLQAMLHDRHESIRAWAVRLLTDDMPIDTIFSQQIDGVSTVPDQLMSSLVTLARDDSSGLVRLVLASTIQRLPVNRRLELARPLVAHADDAPDHNLPGLIWTGLIPVAVADPHGLVSLAGDCQFPELARAISRRLAEDIDSQPAPISELLGLADSKGDELRESVLTGLTEALAGHHKARKPTTWDAFRARLASSDDSTVSSRLRNLDVLFGDGRALDEVKRLALDDKLDLEARKSALKTLIESRPPDLRSICERLIRVRFLNAVALRGLALSDDPAVGRLLAANYRGFHPSERSAALEALVSRPTFAKALLDQVAAGKIPRSDITAFHARQILGLDSPELSRRLSEVWGELRTTSADRCERISALKSRLGSRELAAADRSKGRAVFEKACASCHRLYGNGADIGPDLTGSGRTDLDYLLENIVDPSAVVSADYRMSVVAMSDGRTLNALVKGRTDHTITLQTPTEAVTVDRADVEEIKPSPLSLMPEGIFDTLSPTEVRDLTAYLIQRTQVPLPKETR